MYATLGDISFEPLAGFDSVSEQTDAVVAQYALVQGKPFVQPKAPNLRELNLGMRLHQRFIYVREAVLQLRAYLENGTIVTLTWGNGNVEGRYVVVSLSKNVEESDAQGNVFMASVNLVLLEVPDGQLLDAKQQDSYKKAFGIGDFTTPVVFIPPPPPSPLQLFRKYVKQAMRDAALIEALAYGGRFPDLGTNLGQVIGNAQANIVLMGTNYATFGSTYDVPDVSAYISDVSGSLGTLAGLDPLTDPSAFNLGLADYLSKNRALCF